MNVRLANIDDKQSVLALLDQLGDEVNRTRGIFTPNTEAQTVGGPIFEEILSRKDTLIFLAEEKEEIIGLATFYILPIMRHGNYAGHIEEFIVDKVMRGKGIGTALFDAIKKYCKENNIKVIKLDSGIELTEAHKFYEKNGGKFTEMMFRFDIE
ncbi:MAG TPA: GNAT family N-acetyltransferase [Candidatus Nitrosocosmicus sp.]|nr:GNAT family N-acetyltransferase [Candidatus Nitrosocosmicus sp.]